MSTEYPTIMHRWFDEVWNNKNETAVDEMLAADGVGYGLGEENIVGPDQFKIFHRAFVSAYPDLKVIVEDTVAEGDKIAARCRVTGTHNGDGIGLAATNRPVEFTGMVIISLKDGKIVESWNEFDFVTMYGQLGLAHQPQILERNKAVVRDWFEKVWNAKDASLIDTVMTDETVHHGIVGAPEGRLTGRQEFREFWDIMLTAFPDIHFDIRDVFAEGDKVGARYVATGTQMGPLPNFPEVTGRKVEFTGGGMCSIDDQGRFIQVWNEIDFGKMLQDLTSGD